MIDRNDLRAASSIDGLLNLLGKLNYSANGKKGVFPRQIIKTFEFPRPVNESLEKGGGIYRIGNVGDVEVLLLKYAASKERDLRQLARISALWIAKNRPEKDFLTIHRSSDPNSRSKDGRYLRFAIGYRDKKGRMVTPKIATLALDTKEPTRFIVEKIRQIKFNGEKDFYSALIAALSKEELTKRFYKEYALVLDYLAEGIAEANPTISEFKISKGHKKEPSLALTKFCLRLMGRLMFLYFTQEKRWLDGDKNFLAHMFDEYFARVSERQNSFYERYLSILFFDVLNTPKKQREGVATKWKYIPYLNGGLFQPSKMDRAVKVPDWCFKKSAHVDQRIAKDGIMDLFEKYHFTVASETPDEKEVALDPDMLGQVYENILQDEERHKRGAFYTPRSVVHYMSRHALARYLATRLDHNFRNVLNWIDGREEFPRHLLRDATAALDEVRIIDPAIGSGGFATGILYEILDWRLLLWRVEQNLDAEYPPPARQFQEWKWQTIRDSLFGVDIKEEAVEVAKLRLWLSLMVDDETDVTQDEPHTLPNLELNFVVGDSLFDRSPRSVPPSLKRDKLLAFRKKYFETSAMSDDDIPDEFSQYFTRGNVIYGDQSYDIVRFGGIFGDIMENGGFHIVITNPPYGKDKDHRTAEEQLEKIYGLESRDKYGPFLIQGMDLLRNGGLLAYVTADTWRTLKSHLPLREQLLSKCQFREMVSLPPWTFQTTVNTMIISIQNLPQADQKMRVVEASYLGERDQILLETTLQQLTDPTRAQGNAPEWAYVPEDPNKPKFSQLPLFIGDPGFYPLFDETLPLSDVEVGHHKFRARELIFNGKKLQLLKLGDVVDAKVGLQTSDNDYYLRQKDGVHGSYQIIDEKLILKDEERAGLTAEEKLNGVDPKKYGGRHFAPYDKGGESDVRGGWLPNWYVPTPYFIDWSKSAVKRMKTLTISERKKREGETQRKGDEKKICSRFQNAEYYFRPGITYTTTGIYAPFFRLNSRSVFGHKGSCLFRKIETFNEKIILAYLCSKTFKYLMKVFLDHTVENREGRIVLASLPVSLIEDVSIAKWGEEAITRRKKDFLADVSDLEEQIEEMIMDHFGFTKAQREEILRWYSLKYGAVKIETEEAVA